jgi:hypothetical protein
LGAGVCAAAIGGAAAAAAEGCGGTTADAPGSGAMGVASCARTGQVRPAIPHTISPKLNATQPVNRLSITTNIPETSEISASYLKSQQYSLAG